MVLVVASGYFDPLHAGHIEYLERAKKLGDTLIVIVNNDHQASLKKGRSFMKIKDRIRVVRALKCVDVAVEAVDTDRTVCKTLSMLHPDIFTNGGDQTNQSIPESTICGEMHISLVDGLGEKIQSSSNIIKSSLQGEGYNYN